METCCEYLDKTIYVSSDQQKIINRVRKLAEQYPDQVTIKNQPEQNDGCTVREIRANSNVSSGCTEYTL